MAKRKSKEELTAKRDDGYKRTVKIGYNSDDEDFEIELVRQLDAKGYLLCVYPTSANIHVVHQGRIVWGQTGIEKFVSELPPLPKEAA